MDAVQVGHLSKKAASLTVVQAGILFGSGVSIALVLPQQLAHASVAGSTLVAVVCLITCRIGARLCIVCLGGILALWHVDNRLSRQLPFALEDQIFTIAGSVDGLPKHERRRSVFHFRVDTTFAQPAVLRGQLISLAWYEKSWSVDRYRVHAGARWQFCVRLRTPRGLINPGGGDRERDALVDAIAATGVVCQRQRANELTPAHGADAWREQMAEQIAQGARSPFFRFVQAFAIGDTRALTADDWQLLRQAGLTHLIAISGFHVCFVANALGYSAVLLWLVFPRLGRWLPRHTARALAAACAAIGYALLTGTSLPTVRTVIMMVIVAIALVFSRHPPMHAVFVLGVAIILVFRPLSVLTAGFWLSCSGVAWLIWALNPSVQSRLRELVMAQWVVSLGLLPISLFLFGTMSYIGPFLNILVIPWWSCTVIPLAVIGTALAVLHPSLGQLCWHWAAVSFGYSWLIIRTLCHFSWASDWFPQCSLGATLLALGGAAWILMPRKTPAKLVALPLWLPLLWPDCPVPEAGTVRLVVFDVGQGLSVLVQTSEHALLYDAGPAFQDGFDAGEQVVVPSLHALGLRRLDKLVISHADADHAGGQRAVASAYASPSLQQLAPAHAPLPRMIPCAAGQSWRWDGVLFEFLSPQPGMPYVGNRSSCVLIIRVGQAAVLLPGDIDKTVEAQLSQRTPFALHAEVVIAPHHGSATSSSLPFIAATQAQLVVVSAGYKNHNGHPHPVILKRWRDSGAKVCQTPVTGALEVWLDPHRLRYNAYRHQRARLWDIVERQRSDGILCD